MPTPPLSTPTSGMCLSIIGPYYMNIYGMYCRITKYKNNFWATLTYHFRNFSSTITKMPICKDQQIDYFLLINNVPDFQKKCLFPFWVILNNNNLFLKRNSFFELSQSFLTNITIVPARVAFKQRYQLCKERQIAGYSRVQTIHTMRLL